MNGEIHSPSPDFILEWPLNNTVRQEKLEIVFSKLILVACRYMLDTASIWFNEGMLRDVKPQGSENSEAPWKEAGCCNRSKNICTLVVSLSSSFRCVLLWRLFSYVNQEYDIFADPDPMHFHIVPFELSCSCKLLFCFLVDSQAAKTILKIADESLIDDWNKQYPKATLRIPS